MASNLLDDDGGRNETPEPKVVCTYLFCIVFEKQKDVAITVEDEDCSVDNIIQCEASNVDHESNMSTLANGGQIAPDELEHTHAVECSCPGHLAAEEAFRMEASQVKQRLVEKDVRVRVGKLTQDIHDLITASFL